VVDAKDLLLAKTEPTSSLMRLAEARSVPIGFSSTTRVSGVTSPAAPALRQIGPKSCGPVAR
jgi:hypothetical protein